MFDGKVYDILIVGGGPAGMTAAIYALRANKSVCLLEKNSLGGQITHSPRVENYPGIKEMTGNEFAERLAEQIMTLNADIEMGTVVSVRTAGVNRVVFTQEGGAYKCRAVIIATGTKHRLLGLPGEEELLGNGIYFCAVCDGAYFKGQSVAVIGGGNSALQEAILLADICRQVTVVQNLADFTGEMKLREALMTKPNIRAIFSTVVKGFITESGKLRGLQLTETATGVTSELNCDGVFIAVGMAPENEVFTEVADLDSEGYFASGENCLTRTPGVFVAGDCRAKSIRQLTTAVSDGAVSALTACRYIDEL